MFSIYFFLFFLAAPLSQIGGKCKQSELANCRRTIFHNFQPVELKSQQKKRKKEKRTWVEVFYLPGCTRHYFAAHFSNTRLDSSPMAITITFHQNVTCLAFICRTGTTPQSNPKGDCFSRANRIELPLFPPKKQDCLLI